ncbi:FUSC family protein [Mycobacterium sp. ITM-2016-00317]|uniref:FUSC family protein n=1 Tax=Mycobacterium sp. ITM-2016-00317 TaxID=2099694 RepID=UPI000D460FDA|nr:FUSC family protein [Mycobacterium sp. ITM-2016-00317]WNG89712.1 FUSC family protein [Mycobacterium sp. ITM-2016-00317]
MAAWLAGALGAILAITAAVGHAELGSAMGLGFVLTAVPSLAPTRRAAFATIGIRALAVLIGAVLAVLTLGHPAMLAAVTVAAAVCGGLLARVGPTAALAVVLIAVDVPDDGGAERLLPYLGGALVVAVAWTAWFLCAEALRRRRGAPAPAPPAAGRAWRESWPHAVRVGVAVTAAVWVAGLLPDDLVGAHWLVTSVVLTVQPAAGDTGMRLAQRLSGNAVGALIAAVVLGTHPSIPVVAVLTVVLFTLAMALRPVNYTWWAVTGPPVLLVISEYPQLFPWYEGGVRLAMNLAGAAIVLVVVFGVPALTRRGFRGPATSQKPNQKIVYTKSNQGGAR